MFCPKCGARLQSGAAFCTACGAKSSEVVTEAAAAAKEEAPEAGGVTPEAPKKKKSRKLPIILCVAALVIVGIILALASAGGGEIDYKATVRAYTPYAKSQEIPYTCGQVFDRYLSNAAWDIQKGDNGATVNISGTAKGTDQVLDVTIQVEAAEDNAIFTPGPVKLGGKELSENAFFALFVAYDQQDEDLSHIEELVAEVDLALGHGELLGTFVDPATGISFRYPAWWAAPEVTDVDEIAYLLSSRNNANHQATFKVRQTFDFYNVLSGDAAAVQAAVDDTGFLTFVDYGDAMLGNVPAKALRYQTTGISGDETGISFWYTDGQEVYEVMCTYSDSTSAIYAPIFVAMVESYSVTTPQRDSAAALASGLCFRGVPVDELLGASYDDMINLFGEPDLSLYDNEENHYGDAIINFDMWSLDRPYLDGITTPSLDDVTYNGYPLSDCYDELSQIMGREPDEARVFYDTYTMTYTWEHMGSDAFLTVRTPATEDSTAITEVSISWWCM